MIQINADLFVPILSLMFNGTTKSFDLFSTTYVNNTCTVRDGAQIGTPEGILVAPEVLPVTLSLKAASGRGHACLMMVNPVFHHLAIQRTQLDGKSAITGFAVLDGHIVGSKSIDIGGFDLTAMTGGKVAIAWDGDLPWSLMYDGDVPWA